MAKYLCKEYDPHEDPEYTEEPTAYEAYSIESAAEKYVESLHVSWVISGEISDQMSVMPVLVEAPDGRQYIVEVKFEQVFVAKATGKVIDV